MCHTSGRGRETTGHTVGIYIIYSTALISMTSLKFQQLYESIILPTTLKLLYSTLLNIKGNYSSPSPLLYLQHSDNRSTVYVSNIQHHFGDHDLQELFQQVNGWDRALGYKLFCIKFDLYTCIISVWTFTRGSSRQEQSWKSKGFAYTEYLNEVYHTLLDTCTPPLVLKVCKWLCLLLG